MAGRSGVHISYLIVSLVVCLGLVFWVVRLNSMNEDLGKKDLGKGQEIERQKAAYAKLDLETRDLRKILLGTPDKTADVVDFETRIKEGKDLCAQASGEEQPQYDNIIDLYESQYEIIRQLKEAATTALKAKQASEEDYKSLVQSKDDARKNAEQEAEGLRGQINEAQKRAEKIERDASEDSQRQRTENEAIVDELKVQIADLKRQNWLTENKLKLSNDRIAHLEEERIQAVKSQNVPPDGKIVDVDNDLDYAWIDIGKSDQLTAGIIFEVYQNVKGGKRLAKGRVQVLTVQADLAKVAILNTVDRLHPIGKEDFVTSPFFSRDEVPRFVIAGEKTKLNRWSKEELIKKIQKYGGEVGKDVTIDTTYLVVIDGYESTPEYSTARELRVKIITEAELSGMIE